MQPKKGIAIDAGTATLRYARPGVRGSFYVSNNYLSATGLYAALRGQVPESRPDHQGYPVWQDGPLASLLEQIRTRFRP